MIPCFPVSVNVFAKKTLLFLMYFTAGERLRYGTIFCQKKADREVLRLPLAD
jgi:hypothetical protein